jgi:hypothetical protein
MEREGGTGAVPPLMFAWDEEALVRGVASLRVALGLREPDPAMDALIRRALVASVRWWRPSPAEQWHYALQVMRAELAYREAEKVSCARRADTG